jgi:1,4-alpha-glucan branching enzyme
MSDTALTLPPLDNATAASLADARHGDPFGVLGPHGSGRDRVIRVFLPGARQVEVLDRAGQRIGVLEAMAPTGLFSGKAAGKDRYTLRITWPGGVQETEDPYSFGPLLGDLDLHLFNEGRHFTLGTALGSRAMTIDGVAGVRFAVWAPNAQRVAVVGDFNGWDGRRNPMRRRFPAGVWELFVPRVSHGAHYKYEIRGADGTLLPLKADPVGQQAEMPPATASVVPDPRPYNWRDEAWMQSRARRHAKDAPLSIYEVHLPSWLKRDNGGLMSWDDAIDRLIPYLIDMHFTHVEFLPITEHPFGGSWGYQPLGLFAPTARHGSPESFKRFVDALHRAGIGIILDWVPAHFPTDPHGLARFDGTALYEHLDPREGFHHDWNTYIYNLGRREVQGFLIASALHWLEDFHIDGLRVDAVASMLYRDYSRSADQWVPNVHGGRENLEAVGFIKHLNAVVGERCPGAMMIAEESTAWPGVTRAVDQGGLGFHYKWNMGWMHDTLDYMSHEPVYRSYHHGEITFGLVYAFSERFMLPISHDEVVHGKRSLLAKMPGDRWQKFANLRAYVGFMWTHPGKKLLFMGGEIGQPQEWNHDGELPWSLLDQDDHAGVQRLVRDLNRLYRAEAALYGRDSDPDGFAWVIGDDHQNSVFAFLRRGQDGAPLLAIVNMTPVPRHNYRIGVPQAGAWREILNTDSAFYGGSNVGNAGLMMTAAVPAHGNAQSLTLVLPPLATILFRGEG